MIDYACEPYTSLLDEDFIRLFHQEGFVRTAERLQWVMNPPTGQGQVAVARDNGAVVGLAAMIPTILVKGKERRAASFVFDLIVDRSTRGRNIFSGLARTLHSASLKAGRDLIWGFPNQIAARGWFGRYRWTSLGPPPLAMRPLRAGAFLAKIHPALRRLNVPLALPVSKTAQGIGFVEVFGDDYDRLWNVSRAPDAWTVDRDSRWMNWRLLEGPDPCRVVAFRSPQGAIEAVAATRLAARGDLSVLNLLEALALPDRKRRLASLIRRELAVASRHRADMAIAWNSPGSSVFNTLRGSGFLPIPASMRPAPTFIGGRDLSETEGFLKGGAPLNVSLMDLDSI